MDGPKKQRTASLTALLALLLALLWTGPAASDPPTSPGAVDPTFAQTLSGLNGWVSSVVDQPDGRVLVGGSFSELDGKPVAKLFRLNANGTVDASLGQTGTGLSGGYRGVNLLLMPNGKILVGGDFAEYSGQPAGMLIRLNSDGSRDATLNSAGSGFASDGDGVRGMTVQDDGKIAKVCVYALNSAGRSADACSLATVK